MRRITDRTGLGSVCEAPLFRHLLRQERARVDRLGGTFALIVADASRDPRSPAVISAFCRRLREIDSAGWLDGSRVGLLLPGTGLTGGAVVASSLRLELGTMDAGLGVFSYPHCWGQKGKASRHWPSDVPVLSMESVIQFFVRPSSVLKRATDVAGSLLGLVVLAPFMLAIAAYVRCVSAGPALFRQVRVGRAGRRFVFLKFRTMHAGSGADLHRRHLADLIHGGAPMQKLDGRDPRFIRGAGILRRSSLDELPQLINVLRGDMSLIGPRPCIPYEAREYSLWHTRRLDCLPGMTGLWQVSGKNRLTFEQMVRLDIAYAARRSMLLDARILLRTVPTVIGEAWAAASRRWERLRVPQAGKDFARRAFGGV